MSAELRAARWRLAGRFAALVLALSLGGSAAVYGYVSRALRGAFDATHELAMQSMLESVETGGPALTVNERGFHEEFNELNLTLGVVAVGLWGADGRPLAGASLHHVPLSADGPAREEQGEGDHAVVLRRQRLGPGGRAGLLVVSRRASDVARGLSSLATGLALLVPLTLLGALGVGWLMARQALRPVQRAFDQQRAFMADASHELRTPLAIIRAQAEVQLDAGAEAHRAALSVVARTAEQLSVLVDDLLFLSRVDAGSLAPRRLSFSLDELIEETIEAFTPLAEARGSQLAWQAPPAGIELVADPSQIQRLVAILLDNALCHGDPGPIHVSARLVGRSIQLCVQDSGPGIPPSLLPRVFDRFFRGDPPQGPRSSPRGRPPGHGLGLAIARSIALAHHGTIALGPGKLGGTAAVVTLPARP